MRAALQQVEDHIATPMRQVEERIGTSMQAPFAKATVRICVFFCDQVVGVLLWHMGQGQGFFSCAMAFLHFCICARARFYFGGAGKQQRF